MLVVTTLVCVCRWAVHVSVCGCVYVTCIYIYTCDVYTCVCCAVSGCCCGTVMCIHVFAVLCQDAAVGL